MRKSLEIHRKRRSNRRYYLKSPSHKLLYGHNYRRDTAYPRNIPICLVCGNLRPYVLEYKVTSPADNTGVDLSNAASKEENTVVEYEIDPKVGEAHKHLFNVTGKIELKLESGISQKITLLVCHCGANYGYPEYRVEQARNEGTQNTKILLKKLGWI